MQADTAVDAPADSLKYVSDLFRTRAAAPKVSLLRRIVAVMRADLAPNTAAFGERSASQGQARQMLFETGDNAVDLRVTAIEDCFAIRGQILGEAFENGTVELANDQNTFEAAIGDDSEFKLSNITAGDYSLTIRGGTAEIFIEQISLH